MSVLMVTSLGDVVIDLFTDRCPLTCKNFLKLCKIKYYNGCLFHTVQKDFTAQTGDPTGTGTGGDSVYKFLYGDQARFLDDEIHLDVKHSKKGTVAMASAGENLNASQFYFTLRDDLEYLDGKHTVFGEIAEGLDTLTRINETYVDEKSRPYKNIRIKHTYILDDPFEDPSELTNLIPDASPEGKPKDEVDDNVRLEDDWVPMDEQLDTRELEEVLRAKDAHSRAVVLETIGDIPDAEVKPPDNVLFVCKLNPVTQDADLHTIFSRFGVVTSADVIRDQKSGDSLCYAFIEFEDKAASEEAYFKMDNALIDDRRIHVDFSQSVSKLWSQYRRKGQAGQGGACFKCGSTDHIAKDCTGDSTSKQTQTKYTLKDDNTQRGGDRSRRYEMVFEGDADKGPAHSKRRRDDTAEHDEKRNKRDAHEEKRRGSHDTERRRERSPYRGRSKEYPEKNGLSDRRKTDVRDHRDDREHKRRHVDDKYRRDDKEYEKSRRGDGYKRNERDYEKGPVDDGGRGDRKKENETRNKSGNEDVRGSRRDRRDVGDDGFGHKRRDEERDRDRRRH